MKENKLCKRNKHFVDGENILGTFVVSLFIKITNAGNKT